MMAAVKFNRYSLWSVYNYSDEKGIVLTPKEGNSKKIILQKLLEMEDIELECFKKYEPTLNDIFVEKVGGN